MPSKRPKIDQLANMICKLIYAQSIDVNVDEYLRPFVPGRGPSDEDTDIRVGGVIDCRLIAEVMIKELS